MNYESQDDVRLRLGGSVVAYQGHPVKVEDVVDRQRVLVTDLVTGNTNTVKWQDLNLEPSALPLGYVQVDDDTLALVTRRPCRRYKQGLTVENIHAVRVLGRRRGRPEPEQAPRGAPAGGRGDIAIAPTQRQLVNTMMGKFTEIGTAFQKVRSEAARVQAFSKDWAVGREDGDLCIIYRGEVVGFATDNSIRLKPERSYLKESLELCLK